jgi:hypothetical protein
MDSMQLEGGFGGMRDRFDLIIPPEKTHRGYQQAKKTDAYFILACPLQKALKPSVSFIHFFSYASKGT